MGAINLPGAEFKTLVIKMVSELMGNIEELNESLHKEIEIIKKNQSEMNTKIEMEYTLDKINSRLDKAEKRISNLGTKVAQTS